jgi:hypothetical protein
MGIAACSEGCSRPALVGENGVAIPQTASRSRGLNCGSPSGGMQEEVAGASRFLPTMGMTSWSGQETAAK